MSEPEKQLQTFLARWSNRKLAARHDPEPPAATAERRTDSAERNDGAPADTAEQPTLPTAEAAPKLPTAEAAPELPPIESIGARSDIRAFLAPGVPEAITRAALRRAWLADPAIRDFIGIAENQWDFNDPQGAPGFGPLDLTPNLRRMIAELTGEAATVADVSQPPQTLSDAANEGGTAASDASAAAEHDAPHRHAAAPQNDVAAQDETDRAATKCAAENVTARRHGSALPK